MHSCAPFPPFPKTPPSSAFNPAVWAPLWQPKTPNIDPHHAEALYPYTRPERKNRVEISYTQKFLIRSTAFPTVTLPYRVVQALNQHCPSSVVVEPASKALQDLLRRLRRSGFVVAAVAPRSSDATCTLVVYHQLGLKPRPPATWPVVARFGTWGTALFTVHKSPR